jgi:hypothetical protein
LCLKSISDRAQRCDDSSGWSAMAKVACWLEDVAGITVEFIGRNALDRYSTRTLRASGKHLAFEVLIDGGWLWISACPMDSGSQERLMTVGDGPSGWRACCKLLLALERAEVSSLSRPIFRANREAPILLLLIEPFAVGTPVLADKKTPRLAVPRNASSVFHVLGVVAVEVQLVLQSPGVFSAHQFRAFRGETLSLNS